jgi:hypothetical protein
MTLNDVTNKSIGKRVSHGANPGKIKRDLIHCLPDGFDVLDTKTIPLGAISHEGAKAFFELECFIHNELIIEHIIQFVKLRRCNNLGYILNNRIEAIDFRSI